MHANKFTCHQKFLPASLSHTRRFQKAFHTPGFRGRRAARPATDATARRGSV